MAGTRTPLSKGQLTTLYSSSIKSRPADPSTILVLYEYATSFFFLSWRSEDAMICTISERNTRELASSLARFLLLYRLARGFNVMTFSGQSPTLMGDDGAPAGSSELERAYYGEAGAYMDEHIFGKGVRFCSPCQGVAYDRKSCLDLGLDLRLDWDHT